MSIYSRINSKFVACFLIIAVAGLTTGCKTAGFKKPDLSGLAFWKKDDAATQLPPPPARHFDPAPLGGEEAMMADADASNRSTLDEQNELKRKMAEIEETKQKMSELSNAIVRSASDPIRKPYSLGDTQSKVAASSTDNDFAGGGDFGGSTDFGSTVQKASLNQAQQDFQAAMSSTITENDDFASTKTASTAEASVETPQSRWKDFDLPTELSKSKLNQSLQASKKSLYDATGKLNDAVSTQRSNIANQFSNTTNAFANSTKQIINRFDEVDDNMANAVNSFKASQASNGPLDPIANNGFSAPKSLAPLAKETLGNVNDSLAKASEKIQSTLEPMKEAASNMMAGNAQILKPNAKTEDLDAVQAQVAEAKRQIEMLKQQVLEAQQKSTQTAPSTQQANSIASSFSNDQPSARTAQLEQPRLSANTGNSFELNSSPVNQLRNDSAMKASPGANDSVASPTQSKYKMTPHGGFSPRAAAEPKGQPKDFAPSSNTTLQANSEGNDGGKNTVAPVSNTGGSQARQASTADFVVPEDVLRSKGSYAPGSVYQWK